MPTGALAPRSSGLPRPTDVTPSDVPDNPSVEFCSDELDRFREPLPSIFSCRGVDPATRVSTY